MNVISVSRKKFKQVLDEWASQSEKAPFVTLDVPQTADYYLATRGLAGFGVTRDGELIALFNHTGPQGIGNRLIERAKAEGADHLYCFDTGLVELYKQHGFKVTERFPWDEDQAPDGWNYEKYGKPDLVKMEVRE